MDWRPSQRTLTQVQVSNEPIIERGPVLYGAKVKPPPHAVHQRPLPHVAQQRALPPAAPQPVQQSHYQSLTAAVAPQPVPQPVVQESHYKSLTSGAAPPQGVPQVAAVPAKPRISEEFLELNLSNAAQFANLHADIFTDLDRAVSQWHQIIIRTPVPESERTQVIAAINKRILPQKITPYFFHMEHQRITFYVNMCGLALRTLCRLDLKVPYTSDKFSEIEMTIKLYTKNFNLSEALKEVVSRRLDGQRKFLDLSYINSIPEIQEMVFDPTDNWHIIDQLLRVAEVVAPGLAALRLAGNGIVTLTLLWNFLVHSKWKSLRMLDVSDNEVKSTGTVSLSRTLMISEVYLDRNPICQMLKKDSYISAIRATFPRLAKLDGTYLHTAGGLPYWKPNFIVDSDGDSGEFADQFIDHFFTLYDDPDRSKLGGLYHEKACFSLSCMCLDAQLTTPNARLTTYMSQTRNLFQVTNRRSVRTLLTRGSENILERLSNLPNTLHDPYTFAVDLTVHTPKLTVLTVTGVFRDLAKEKSSNRHFSRTFVLTKQENDEYQITNDILYVSNATTRQTEEAFRYVRPLKKIKKNRPVPNLSEIEKESMTGMVQQLTGMSDPWSRKCLEDTDWDMREALTIFVELYESGIIPKAAFINSK